MNPIDLKTEPVKPYEMDDAHRRLSRLVGRWRGTARTLMGPDADPLEAPWEGEVTSLLGGRFVRFTYRSSVQGTLIAGDMTLAYEAGEKQWRISWIDSFHTSPAILVSTGPAKDGPINVFAKYFAAEGHPHWGWRSEVHDPDGDGWTVRMFNVTPEGEELLGIEILLTRA